MRSPNSSRSLIIVCLLLLATDLVRAQDAKKLSSSGAKSALLADGTVDPKTIPDDLARRMFHLAFAEPDFTSQVSQRRLAPKLASLGLESADESLLKRELASFSVLVERYEKQISAIKLPGTGYSPAQIRSQLIELDQEIAVEVDNTFTRLKGSVSASGATKLDQYINGRVKSHLKLIAPPAM